MKQCKVIVFVNIALSGLLLMGLVLSCASSPKADETPEYTMPQAVLDGAVGIDAEEAKASHTFTAAQFLPWSLDGGKNYVVDANFYSKVQSEGADWARDITKRMLSIVPAGDDDAIIAINLPLSDGAKEKVYAYLFNVSNQGSEAKNLQNTIMKVRLYIPQEMVVEGAASYPVIRVVVRDGAWKQAFLDGEIKNLTTKDIGAGWQTLLVDFAAGSWSFGAAKGSFEAMDVSRVNSVDLNFYAKGIPSSMNVPFYLDWLSFEGMTVSD